MSNSTRPSELRIDEREVGPFVRLRSVRYHPFIYAGMVAEASPQAQAGRIVAVIDKRGELFGHGLYNPRSQIVLRMLRHGPEPPDGAYLRSLVQRAVALRTETLRLGERTNAYRVCHAEADSLSGLIVDRYDDCLSVELFSLGMWNLLGELLPEFERLCGTKHRVIRADDRARQLEGIQLEEQRSEHCPKKVVVVENGVRFRVDLRAGHKTGFFCDQRDNRRRFAELASGRDVLDLCCYTGGFGLYAKTLGGARRVTCVDLDEAAVEAAVRNANLNDVRVQCVHADAFAYARQMQENRRSYGLIALDPPKLILSRGDRREGLRKYLDLNLLAMSLLETDGVLVTCSCSGLLGRDEFLGILRRAGDKLRRSVRVIAVTGPGPDHPVALDCPETEYLTAVWLRLGDR
jgi:23S rRNA (cytosine1962-C5)-methyltransferase